jgi:pyruvate kinase
VARQLKLCWGVRPQLIARSATTDQMLAHTDSELLKSGDVSPGDMVVVTMGAPVALHGSTNLMKLHRIGEVSPA